MASRKKCPRGHTGHMIQILIPSTIPGRNKKVWFCDYILGVTGVESANFKTIQCGDIPIGQDMPVGMLKTGDAW